MKNHCLLLLLFLSFLSCAPKKDSLQKPLFEENESLLIYKSEDFSNVRIAIKSVLLANKETGKLELRMNVLNKLEAPFKFDFMQIQLATKGGTRAAPEYTEEFLTKIDAGEQASYSLDFLRPIHSKEVFHAIEYIGDLNPAYEMSLDFIGFPNKTIVFNANSENYQSYLSEFGKEGKYKKYSFSGKDDWETKMKSCFNYDTPTKAVSWREGEWNIGGVVGKMMIYKLGDSLFVTSRVSNQSSINLNIEPEKLQICDSEGGNCKKSGSLTISMKTRKNPRDAGFVIQKAERFQADYAFAWTAEMQEIKIADLGLRTLPKQKPIPCESASFYFAQSGTGVVSSNNSSK